MREKKAAERLPATRVWLRLFSCANLIQRRLRVGYPRAARMIEQMEADGLVGAAGRDGRREVVGRRGPVGAEEA